MSNRVQLISRRYFKEIITKYQAGASVRQLAAEYAVSPPTIIKWCRSQQAEDVSDKAAALQQRRCAVKELYVKGVSFADISKKLGASLSTVARDLFVLRAAGEVEYKQPVKRVETPVRNELKEATGICYVWRNDGVISR
jgi:transposase